MQAGWRKQLHDYLLAPEIYQRKQHELLAGLKGIEPIADDVLIVGCGDTDEEAERIHDVKLLALMERCRSVKLGLGQKKLQFKVKDVHFHGRILSAKGPKPDLDKDRVILDKPNPSDAKGVQLLIGFANYLAKFMPHLSTVCEPLSRLLDKDKYFKYFLLKYFTPLTMTHHIPEAQSTPLVRCWKLVWAIHYGAMHQIIVY